jgi:hypothetical protein
MDVGMQIEISRAADDTFTARANRCATFDEPASDVEASVRVEVTSPHSHLVKSGCGAVTVLRLTNQHRRNGFSGFLAPKT